MARLGGLLVVLTGLRGSHAAGAEDAEALTWLGIESGNSSCMAQCKAPLSACFTDKVTGCRKSMIDFGLCMAGKAITGKTHWEDQMSCFNPDNMLRNQAIYCLMEEYKCIPLKPTNASATYPPNRDKELSGDTGFKLDHLLGDWYKVQGMSTGEPQECLPCTKMAFKPYVAGDVGAPLPEPTDYSKSLTMTTYLHFPVPNGHGKLIPQNQTAVFGPRPDGAGYPHKILNYGFMFGLTFWENYTTVHDGSQEAEPFIIFYAWGRTISGEYPAGFTMAKNASSSPSLKKRMDDVLVQKGFQPKDWCVVDNSCFAKADDADLNAAGAFVV